MRKPRKIPGVVRQYFFGQVVESQPAPIGCLYPMDAPEAQILAVGLGGRLTMSNSDNTGSFTTAGTNKTYGALPNNALTSPATYSLTSGKKIVEFAFVVQEIDGGTINLLGAILTASAVPVVEALVLPGSVGSGTCTLRIKAGPSNTTVFEDNAFPIGDGNIQAAFIFDAATGTFEVKSCGNVLTLSSNTYTATNVFHYIFGGDSAASTPGVTMSITANYSVGNYIQNYSNGEVDVCGNALAEPK